MWPFAIAAVLGSLIGLSELMGRYRDAPFKALGNRYTFLLALINGAASVATLYLVREMDLITWENANESAKSISQILVSGIGAMAILRVGISFQVGTEPLNVSLATLLQPVITAADNEVDRARAAHKLSVTKELMLGLDADKALRELPTFCLFLMQSVSAEDQKRLADDVKALSDQPLNSEVKLLSLGSTLLNTVGENVLKSAVAAYRECHRV